MSTIETILSRAMGDAEFASLLMTNPEEALADYELSAEEIEKLKNLSSAQFEAMATDERRSFGSYDIGTWSGGNHNQSVLKVTNHNESLLKVRRALVPNHNQFVLKVRKGITTNHNQFVLKIRRALYSNHKTNSC